MPDPVLLLQSMATAAVLAAAVLLVLAWPWRKPHPTREPAGWALGTGAGLWLGVWWLGQWPHWPPGDAAGRFLLVLVPAVVLVEVVAAFLRKRWWLPWLLRLGIALGAARLLLHNTVYVADLSGPGTREWSLPQELLILGGLGFGLAALWGLLGLLAKRRPGRLLPLPLALACLGAGVTVMLSGYSSGGQLGFPLAAAVAGPALAALLVSEPRGVTNGLGVGVVGLFALLLLGHFFGQLSIFNATLLFAAPLLGWLPELPYLCKLKPRLRAALALALVAVPVAFAVAHAGQKFAEDARTPGSQQPTAQDYMDFGK
jgi:hypothetical protein